VSGDPCARCGEWVVVQPVIADVPMCADCWRWLGSLSLEAAVMDVMAWKEPPALADVGKVHQACQVLRRLARKAAQIKAAEAKALAVMRHHAGAAKR
jgi:hypothetical protein